MKIYKVDAFTDKPFAGNPAGVCMLDGEKDDRWLQNVAREMNLPETAFLLPRGAGYDLRWFTPTTEIDLCGHATLASAHILYSRGYLADGAAAAFQTKSGRLTAALIDGWIRLDFPAVPAEEAEAPAGLIEALGVRPVYTGRNKFDYLVEVESESKLRDLEPDLASLAKVQMRGVIVTARSQEYDFVSRFFAPAVGIDEDPVTGSAHCCLGPYWRERLGKDDFVAYQVSPRGGLVRVAVRGERVLLSGKAVTILAGELVV
ncbi:MAG: PhzF family phenazine biosynthesis protein [Bacteroidota bacterium]